VISLIFFAGMFVLLWVLLIQPQRRRRAEQRRLHSDLAVGDRTGNERARGEECRRRQG
jgi:preprotein translocase YajC subunit